MQIKTILLTNNSKLSKGVSNNNLYQLTNNTLYQPVCEKVIYDKFT